MSLNYHARITADSSQAKAALTDTAQGTRDLTKDVDALGVTGRKTSAEIDALGATGREASAEIDALAVNGRDATAVLDALADKGRETNTEIDALALTGREASAEFDALRREMAGYQAELVKLKGDHAAATKQIDAMGRELDQLRGKTDKVKPAFNGAAGQVGNLTSQFNDIGVMLAAGQNPLQLAIQQGTQIGQVFQASGAKGKDAFKLLLQGAMAMISPINLITIGTIAMGGALIQWLSSSSDEVDHFAERLENAKAKIEELRFENEFLTSGFKTREEKVLSDDLDAALKELASAERELSQNRGRGAYPFQQAVNTARDRVADAEAELAKLRERQDLNHQLTDETKERLRLEEEGRKRRERDLGTAEELLLSLAEGNELTRVALTYGEDSVMLERARADAARAAMERDLDGLDVSEDLKDAIRDALEQKLALASVDIETGLGAGYRMAKAMADELQRAVGAAISLAAQGINDLQQAEINWQFRDDPTGRAGALAGARFDAQVGDTSGFDLNDQAGLADKRAEIVATAEATEDLRQKTIAWRKEQTETARASGGTAKATKAERDAVADLIARYRDELALLQEIDPVKQEMIRLRGDLAGATDAERAAVQGLIESIAAEELAKAQAAETSEFFRTSMADLIPGLVRGGDEAAASWQRLVSVLEDAAWQALLLGQGPLMGLLGGGGGGAFGGGLIGMVGKLFGFADGGMHYGRGGPRADKELVRVSPGEYTVNAKATQKHRALLEAINAGAPIPGFAAGGYHGTGPAAPGQMALNLQLVDQTSRGIKVEQEEQSDPSRLPRFIASDMVSEALTTRGGKARRTMQGLGLRQPMVRT